MITIKRREFLLTALAGSGALATSGAAIAAEPGDAEAIAAKAARKLAGGRQVRLQALLPAGSEGNVKPIAREFEAQTGVAIDIRTAPVDDINSVLLLNRITAGTRHDIVLPATFGIPDLAEAGILRPLDAFAGRYEPAGFREQMLYNTGNSYLDRFYGYQADGDVYLMFYNADFLEDEAAQHRFSDRYGEPLAVPRTWPELDRQLEFFHDPDRGRYGGSLFRTPRYIAWEWWMRLHSKGVLPFDENMRAQVNGKAAVAALEELTNASRFLSPGCDSNSLVHNWQAFASGNIFCNIGWGGSQKYFRQHASNFRKGLRYSHMPGDRGIGGERTLSFFNWGWNYAVPQNATEPELGYLFALFASSAAMSTIAVREPDGFFDPTRPEHYGDPDIQAVYSKPFLAAHRRAMQSAIPDLYLRGQGEYFLILSDYIIRADRRQLTPYEALQTVNKLWDEVTLRLGREEQQRQWHLLRQHYPAEFTSIA